MMVQSTEGRGAGDGLNLPRFDGHLGEGALLQGTIMPTTKPQSQTTPTGGIPPVGVVAASLSRAKHYDDAFKHQAVENWLRSGRPGTQIARELGVSYPTLKDWKRRYYGDATPLRADLEAENRALKAELQRVREQRDILKKTLGILSEPPKTATNESKR
jgi:transposase